MYFRICPAAFFAGLSDYRRRFSENHSLLYPAHIINAPGEKVNRFGPDVTQL